MLLEQPLHLQRESNEGGISEIDLPLRTWSPNQGAYVDAVTFVKMRWSEASDLFAASSYCLAPVVLNWSPMSRDKD